MKDLVKVESHGRAGGSIVGPVASVSSHSGSLLSLDFFFLFTRPPSTPPSPHASHVRDLRSKGWNDRGRF